MQILHILLLYRTILQLAGNEQLQPLHQQAVHYTRTVPERAVALPLNLLNSKDCFHLSVQKSIYVNIANYLHFYYVISKILHIEYLKN